MVHPQTTVYNATQVCPFSTLVAKSVLVVLQIFMELTPISPVLHAIQCVRAALVQV